MNTYHDQHFDTISLDVNSSDSATANDPEAPRRSTPQRLKIIHDM